MAARTCQIIDLSQYPGNVAFPIALTCWAAELRVSKVSAGQLMNGIALDAIFHPTDGGVLVFPPLSDALGLPINYNDTIIFDGTNADAAIAGVLVCFLYDPVREDRDRLENERRYVERFGLISPAALPHGNNAGHKLLGHNGGGTITFRKGNA